MDFSRRGGKERWAPEYQTAQGKPYLVEFEPLRECPVSLITPESRVLVSQLSRMEFVQEATGATLYGAGLESWPPEMVEASVALRSELNRIENAAHEMEALDREARTPPTGKDPEE